MHHAPSVTLPVGRSLWALGLGTAAWLGGLAALALWWASADVSGGRLALLCLVLGVTGALAGWAWWSAPRGELLWDGTWHWQPAGPAPGASARGPAMLALNTPAVVLDFQSVLLLRLRTPAAAAAGRCPAALWVERRAAGPGAAGDERWRSLRRAVYSRAALAVQPPGAAIS